MKIAVIGLGYVGLPLAVAFSEKYSVVGFDINNTRIEELINYIDITGELNESDLKSASNITYTSDLEKLKDCTFFIITVPTPVNSSNQPEITALRKASKTVGSILKPGDYVVYESTVYPGLTEDECVPILEKESKLIFNKDFFVGYSPERINPGDKKYTLKKIKKITSGSTIESAKFIDQVYASIIEAGTYLVNSIRVAEAAKVIENAQRDINIAFVNELSIIFNKLGLDTLEVLEAASTKWNFLKFKPGLVGGHCIGVDPYYLTYKAQQVNYHPEILLAGRRVNDSMGKYVAQQVIKLLIKDGHNIKNSKCLIMGFTFKENCPDVRNTKVIDIYNELIDFGVHCDVFDPLASNSEVLTEYSISLLDKPEYSTYSAVIYAVAHNIFLEDGLEHFPRNTIIYDLKGIWDKSKTHARL